ncbi:stage II sporulation protein M [Desulfosarcina ovata]|uniref:Stage II sporulation protein M n=1 Tax=Desulfosarcina ovata subsp. ovata TaxID=2752305 RepID=A0A5K8ABG2_9BACT|nr:stage II sporulation protein M [Desulfosarcina ovata]BBO89945.1 hypothetical protein DSCOOX_31250 [Desulfosarcina ovata subsp. ovata]
MQLATPSHEPGRTMLKREYARALATLYQARHGIAIVVVVYGAACAGGWKYAGALNFLHQTVSGLVDTFAAKRGMDFVFSLFMHNLVATYTTMCLLTLWGLVPLITAAANGLLLGWIVATAIGASIPDAAAMLVPHGLFEWPAMLISWGVSLWRGLGYRFNGLPGTYFDRWLTANRVFFLIVLPLLLVAAIIEGRAFLFSGVAG